MADRAEQLRRHESRIVWFQAVLVTAVVLGVLFGLFGYRPRVAPAATENRGRVVLLNLGNPELPGQAEWARWLECHDPGLFSRADTVHGYLAKLPPTERPLPGGLDFARHPAMAVTLPAAPAFAPLRPIGAGKREPFSGYRPGAIPVLPLSLPPPVAVEPVLEWSIPAPAGFSLAGLDWRKLVRPDEPELQLALSRSADPAARCRIEVIAGGSAALREALFRLLLSESERLLRPGERVELRIRWPRETKP